MNVVPAKDQRSPAQSAVSPQVTVTAGLPVRGPPGGIGVPAPVICNVSEKKYIFTNLLDK